MSNGASAFLEQTKAHETKDVAKDLLNALELIQGFNWNLEAEGSDPAFGREIKRRALAAIERAKRLNL